MMEEPATNTESSRAKEIDAGLIPLQMQNVILDMPSKPGIQFDNRESVNATKWAFEQLVSQKQYLTTFTLPFQTKTPDKPLFIMPNSWKAITDIHFRQFTDLFFFKSWKWHLTFEIRSNFQQVGMISIAFVNCPVNAFPYITGSPLTYVDSSLTSTITPGLNGIPDDTLRDHSIFNLHSIVQLPHKHVMLGENQQVNVTMNWLSPFKSAFGQYSGSKPDKQSNPNDPIYDMGFLFVTNPIPLNCAAGADANCTVRVWSQLTDVEYSGYCPTDSII